jgi:hypothetical protein
VLGWTVASALAQPANAQLISQKTLSTAMVVTMAQTAISSTPMSGWRPAAGLIISNGADLFRPEGTFLATRRPLFHTTREEALFVLISVDMVDLRARPPHRSARVQQAGHRIATAQSVGTLSAEEPVSLGKSLMALR